MGAMQTRPMEMQSSALIFGSYSNFLQRSNGFNLISLDFLYPVTCGLLENIKMLESIGKGLLKEATIFGFLHATFLTFMVVPKCSF